MRRRSSAEGREGTGHNPVSSKEMPKREKWHKLCLAIRDAGNLAIELGSQRVPTNSCIPKCNRKTGLREGIKPCIKMGPLMWDATPIAGTDCQLRSPVVWYDGADMVFHYPFNPWAMADAIDDGTDAAIRIQVHLYCMDIGMHCKNLPDRNVSGTSTVI